MSRWERYSAYKESDIEWIGEIPAHWEIEKFKHLFMEKKKTKDPTLPAGSISFGKVVTKDDDRIPIETKLSYQVVSKGEFLVNPLNLNYDLKSLRIALSNIDVVVSPGYLVLKTKSEKIHKKYFGYLLHLFDILFMKTLGAGVRQTISFNDLANCKLPLPPLPEQKAIAEFLDRKTEQIDRAIAAKERLIALLKERRQILIHRAVTRGLDPNAPTKDSGIEWIGKIPAHWEVRRLKQVAVNLNHRRVPIDTNIRGRMKKKIYNYYGATGAIDKVEDYIFDEPTILIAEDGANLIMRNIKLIYYPEGKYWVNNHAHILKEIKNVINRMFLGTFLESIDYSIYITGAAQPKLTKEKLMDISIIVPSLKEQEDIIKYLSIKIGRIDHAIEAQKNQIEKLKEYKDTLIDSLVKGERRVV